MISKSLIPGWDVVSHDDPIMLGDRYFGSHEYETIVPVERHWAEVHNAEWVGKCWRELHGSAGHPYTVIRRDHDWKPPAKRLKMSRIGSMRLPLP